MCKVECLSFTGRDAELRADDYKCPICKNVLDVSSRPFVCTQTFWSLISPVACVFSCQCFDVMVLVLCGIAVGSVWVK